MYAITIASIKMQVKFNDSMSILWICIYTTREDILSANDLLKLIETIVKTFENDLKTKIT